ncbi:hypothetical protein [Aureimonas glaciei]|nr:hypothetical protein [Aureimonas glaciei]
MSFFQNKMASLLATLVVVGVALFCSSAARAHANHAGEATELSARSVVSPVDSVQPAADGDAAEEIASATGEDGAVDGHRVAGTSCCGTGVSNCMAASVGTAAGALAAPPSGRTHDAAREPGALQGVVLDGMIRPPKPFV